MADRDLWAVGQQLGRIPRGIIEVVKRCKQGLPLVILTPPFLENRIPFPTLFWLTCPKLVKSISRLEDKGMIKYWQQKAAESGHLTELLQEAQSDYLKRRSSLARQQTCLYRNQAKLKKQFDRVYPEPFDYAQDKLSRGAHCKGIGGVEDLTKIKCLHAHYAHFLATGKNPVGEMVAEALGDFRCQKMCLKA